MEMISKLPMLKELHLICSCNFKKAIEVAGRCCPQLKSLILINTIFTCPKMECNEDALAIAENMPGLHHLELYGPKRITKDGLLAITESCPHLESLDVQLSVANVGPEFVRRLSQRIKHLRLSYEYPNEYSDDLDYLNDDNPSELSQTSTDDETGGLDSLDEDDEINNVSYDYHYCQFSGSSDIDSDD